MKSLNEWTRKELLALPVRCWSEVSTYDSVLLLSTRKKHDSGWAMIAIIGVKDGAPIEIASACSDDIEWKAHPMDVLLNGAYSIGQIRMDCCFKSGALHAWSRYSKFKVGCALSSIDIKVCIAGQENESE